jgi:hypothetical protein
LTHALSFVSVLEDEEKSAELEQLWPVLIDVSELLPLATALRDQVHALEALVMQIEGTSVSEQLHRALAVETPRVVEALRKLSDAASSVAYPFRHGDEDASVGDYLVPELPVGTLEQMSNVLGAGGEAVDRLYRLYLRLLGRVAGIAERVEEAMGFPPLEMPEDEEPVAEDAA